METSFVSFIMPIPAGAGSRQFLFFAQYHFLLDKKEGVQRGSPSVVKEGAQLAQRAPKGTWVP